MPQNNNRNHNNNNNNKGANQKTNVINLHLFLLFAVLLLLYVISVGGANASLHTVIRAAFSRSAFNSPRSFHCCKNYIVLGRSARQFELKWQYYRASYRQLWSLKLSNSRLEGAVPTLAACVSRAYICSECATFYGKRLWITAVVLQCCNVAITRFECRLLHTRWYEIVAMRRLLFDRSTEYTSEQTASAKSGSPV